MVCRDKARQNGVRLPSPISPPRSWRIRPPPIEKSLKCWWKVFSLQLADRSPNSLGVKMPLRLKTRETENKKSTWWRVQWLVVHVVNVCLVRILMIYLVRWAIILCLTKQILIRCHCQPVWWDLIVAQLLHARSLFSLGQLARRVPIGYFTSLAYVIVCKWCLVL